MKDFKDYSFMENPVAFLSEREKSQSVFNEKIKEAQDKIEEEAELHNDKILYSIPVKALVFNDEDDRKGYIKKGFINYGIFQINRLEVVHHELLHQYGKGVRYIYFEFILDKMNEYSKELEVKKDDGGRAQYSSDEIYFRDEKKRIGDWGGGMFFLKEENYIACKNYILQLIEGLGVKNKNIQAVKTQS